MFVYIEQNREIPLSKHLGLKNYENQSIISKSLENSVILLWSALVVVVNIYSIIFLPLCDLL